MTAAPDCQDLRDPLSADALLAPANDAGGADWVDEVRANSESWGRFELVFDEATGQYDLKEVAPAAAAQPVETPAALETAQSLVETQIFLDALADDCAFELAGWASLAGPTGPSAFHTPFYWAPALTTPADFAAVAALGQSRCGAAWPARAA